MSFDAKLWDLFTDIKANAAEASEKAQELCISYLGSSWKGDTFHLSKISGGMSNLVFKCENQGQHVLLRIQCKKDVMQLQNEVAIFMSLANHGLGPKLLGIFPGGRLEEFLPSRTLTYDETKSVRYSKHVAKAMARIHQVKVPLAKTPQVVPTMHQWLERIERNGGTEWKLWNSAKIPTDKFPAKVTLSDLKTELSIVEKYLENCHSAACLGHNDLFATNILLKDGFDIEEDGSVWKKGSSEREKTDESPLVLIDFEFGMYNYRGFDIGNHMNELAMTYFEEMPTYTVDIHQIDNKQIRKAFCDAYLQETYNLVEKEKMDEIGFSGDLKRDVETLTKEVENFMTISSLWCGLWQIICVQESITGMDFYNAFRDRLCIYYYTKSF